MKLNYDEIQPIEREEHENSLSGKEENDKNCKNIYPSHDYLAREKFTNIIEDPSVEN